MKKIILLLLVFLVFTSCGTYQLTQHSKINYVLTVNPNGRVIKLPINKIILKNDPYFYTNWRFYWNNQWYWGYNWWYHVDDTYWRPILHRYYRGYRPNLRNHSLYTRNIVGVRRVKTINYRKSSNNNPKIHVNRQNRVRVRVRSNTPINQRKSTKKRINRLKKRG